ncbi:MAG: GntR family transcriptional regulator [Chloroflexota bacterium]
MGTGTEVDLPLPRIAPRVLRQEVLGALRTAILNGEIPAGARLLEADVAARMGVSRAPVREALRQLEQEGLVESTAHRGAVVTGLPDDEVEAIYALRAVIETKAIERVCATATPEEVASLDGLVAEMDAALARGDLPAIADLDLRFHRRLVELSGFRLLRRVWSSLDGLVRLKAEQAIARPGPTSGHFRDVSASSHAALVEAIRLGDPELAMRRVQEHILEVPARLREDELGGEAGAGAAAGPTHPA